METSEKRKRDSKKRRARAHTPNIWHHNDVNARFHISFSHSTYLLMKILIGFCAIDILRMQFCVQVFSLRLTSNISSVYRFARASFSFGSSIYIQPTRYTIFTWSLAVFLFSHSFSEFTTRDWSIDANHFRTTFLFYVQLHCSWCCGFSFSIRCGYIFDFETHVQHFHIDSFHMHFSNCEKLTSVSGIYRIVCLPSRTQIMYLFFLCFFLSFATRWVNILHSTSFEWRISVSKSLYYCHTLPCLLSFNIIFVCKSISGL